MSQCSRAPQEAQQSPSAQGRARGRFPLTARGGACPAHTLLLDFWSPGLRDINFCLHCQLVVLCYSSCDSLIHTHACVASPSPVVFIIRTQLCS